MRATQLTDFGTDQSSVMTVHCIKMRTSWSRATTAKITPATKRKCLCIHERSSKVLSRIALKAPANVQRTKWSPKWSRTRDHERVFNGTKRDARSIFAIPINTCRVRTKRVGTTATKFRVRCFQPLSHLSEPLQIMTFRADGQRRKMPICYRFATQSCFGAPLERLAARRQRFRPRPPA
jgi:hypothetical protein